MNLQKIQNRLNEFIESNNKELMTSSEYIVYIANLLFALSTPALAMDSELSVIDSKDYFSVESALMKYPDHPHLQCLIMAHKLLAVSKSFKND